MISASQVAVNMDIGMPLDSGSSRKSAVGGEPVKAVDSTCDKTYPSRPGKRDTPSDIHSNDTAGKVAVFMTSLACTGCAVMRPSTSL